MIIIIDFGSQLAHLISKKIRSLNEYTEIFPPSISIQEIKNLNPIGIIFSGGPDSVYGDNSPTIDKSIFDLGVPILGICYGYQLIAYLNGGIVEKGTKSEYGVTSIEIFEDHKLFSGLGKTEQVLMSHTDKVTQPPRNAHFIAKTDSTTACFVNDQDQQYGIQFHAEVVHTPKGLLIFENFLDICGSKRNWTSAIYLEKEVNNLKKIDNPILMAVSGGVDSTVAAALIERAVPDLLHCVFVDNGLLRAHEAEEVQSIYSSMFKHFHFIDAKDIFLKKLKGISDPEKKRKIIGNTFIEVFEKKSHELEEKYGTFKYLGQGTIYPDRVESAATSNQASVIKSHHNVGGLPEKMQLKLIEPLSDLYKNEVRLLGKELGISNELLLRHPFPGPGLAVRCLGEITEKNIRKIQEADLILRQELKNDPRVEYDRLWQVFFVLLPTVKSVGVMGDARTYENPGIIRIVESTDAMTATVPELPFDLLIKIANKIVNHVKGVNRVCLDLMGKPPGTIEWE